MNTRWIECYLSGDPQIIRGEEGEFVSSDVKGGLVGCIRFPRGLVFEQTNSELDDSVTFRDKLHARITIRG